MRKLETQEERGRKDKRNRIIIGLVLAAVLILSTAGYAFFNQEKTDGATSSKISQNGLDFYPQDSIWVTQISGYNFYFSYLPNETSSLKIKKTLKDYSGKPLYFTQNTLAGGEIVKNIASFVERTQLVCISGENCTGNLPEKNCSSNIIIIKENEQLINPVITEEENCVFIISNNTLKDADSFLYRILGVK